MKIRKFPDKPFVAFLGEKNEIEVLERHGDLICKMTRDAVFFRQIILLLFGSALAVGIGFSLTFPEIAYTPRFWMIFMIVFAVVCWLIFFRNLLGTPRFVVSGATGDIALFRRRTPAPWKTIRPPEISYFAIEKLMYWDEGRETENAVLMLFTTAGERRALCGSPDQELIRSLAEKMSRLTQRKVVVATAGRP